MKSNNLTISIPTPKCKKNCPYCVSKITGRVESNPNKFRSNLNKAKTLADKAGVTNILVTGKGEPLDNPMDVRIMRNIFQDYPLEIQADADRYINASFEEIEILNEYDVVAVSSDYLPKELDKRTNGLLRFTLVVHDGFPAVAFQDIIEYCKKHSIDQLSLRNPTIPKNIQNTKEAQQTKAWIKTYTSKKLYENMVEDFNHLKNNNEAMKLRELNFRATVYDVQGISFTHFDYCVQDQNNGDDIRSLIYMENGHLYTSWSLSSSKIF